MKGAYGLSTILLLSVLVAACDSTEQNTLPSSSQSAGTSTPFDSPEATVTQTESWFQDIALSAGLDFQHRSGATGDYLMPEILGSGVALIDVDNDHDLDVYLVQGQFEQKGNTSGGHTLWLNQLTETGTLSFKENTSNAGLKGSFYGMGTAVADVDNDNDLDLYVVGVDQSALYLNNAGQFTRTDQAINSVWGSSASFCDVNNDSLPDLYVANYVRFSVQQKVICRDTLGREDYCSPDSYSGIPDKLFINQGEGQFVDASSAWGIASAVRAGLGVLCRDFDLDGDQDIYVANDSEPNLLWINQGEKFVDEAASRGAALNMAGLTEGSMGVAAGDFDADGDDDLFMTHWNNETNTIYRNDGAVGFMDVTTRVNLAAPSLSHTGFGTDWVDYDNDGDLDIFVANGAVQRYMTQQGALSDDYGQPNQLFTNTGAGRFQDNSSLAGNTMRMSEAGRAAAFGDLDNDGDIDVVVSSKDAPIRLFMNTVGHEQRWLGVHLHGGPSGLDAQGARVTLTFNDGRTLVRHVRYDGSYQAANDPRIVFGLGNLSDASGLTLTVRWPDGVQQHFKSLAPDRYHELIDQRSSATR